MCGIAGICNTKNAQILIKEMADAIIHRGPDDCGFMYNEDMNIALGHRRLSIIDLSKTGHQPMDSIDGRYSIVFNGEIYNYELLKKELPQNIVSNLKGTSDTEVLIEMISHMGIYETVKKIRGMYAFAVLDKVERELYLVRDRAGEKPLYYDFDV